MDRFFELEEINSGLKLLHERFDEIHQEFIENKEKVIFMNFGAEVGYYMKDEMAYKGWKVAPLYANINDFSTVNGGIERFGDLVDIDNDLDLIRFRANNSVLPKLTQTLIDAGIRKRVGISVVSSGKEIRWHTDPDPEKPGLAIIRGLFGLDIVQEDEKESFLLLRDNQNVEEKVVFKNNQFTFFWGRTRHKVENNLSEPRYMICFDTEVPYEQLNS